MEKHIDLRSDTVTRPTERMRSHMAAAVVGDDVYGDDTTTTALEQRAAEMLGKEAALFVPSGTFGNQLALFVHCNRGDEVILPEACHIVAHEAGAAAVLAGVQLRTIATESGVPDAQEIEKRIRKTVDMHFPKTALIVVETAFSDGTVPTMDALEVVSALAKRYAIPIHMDGARIFNAAHALGVEAAEIAQHATSVMFCLSKGLCAPIGSMLVGTKAFIAEARRIRKQMGGGMRQTGVLAAAGRVALEEMTERLRDDHANAQLLAQELAAMDGIEIIQDVQINLVFFNATRALERSGMTNEQFIQQLNDAGILANGDEDGVFRFATHHDVTTEDVQTVIKLLKQWFTA